MGVTLGLGSVPSSRGSIVYSCIVCRYEAVDVNRYSVAWHVHLDFNHRLSPQLGFDIMSYNIYIGKRQLSKLFDSIPTRRQKE